MSICAVALISHCANIDLLTERKNMEYILLGMIITIIVVGLYFARSTQDYIDEQNERYRRSKK